MRLQIHTVHHSVPMVDNEASEADAEVGHECSWANDKTQTILATKDNV